MKPHPLFDAQPADSTSPPRPRMSRTRNLVTVKCNGCPTTATEVAIRHANGWPQIPLGWCICGETTDGELALWCGQCTFQGRHERPSQP
jgi:hypothetical protein